MTLEHNRSAPSRSVTDIGPGDYIKVGRQWKQVRSNSDHGADRPQRDGNWRVTTTDGSTYSGWGINLYAKAEDMVQR
jgi:hypothetical protein